MAAVVFCLCLAPLPLRAGDVLVLAPEKAASCRPDCLFIDIRPSSVFQQVHIPGSVNLSLRFMGNARFVAGRSVVVIADGLDMDAAARGAAVIMATKRFRSIAVMDGGLAGWAGAGLPLSTAPGARGLEYRVTMATLFSLLQVEGRVIVAVPDEGHQELFGGAQRVVFADLGAGRSVDAHEVERRLRSLDIAGRPVVIAADSEVRARRLCRELRERGSVAGDLYYLAGGLQAAGVFWRNMRSQARHAEDGLDRRCGT